MDKLFQKDKENQNYLQNYINPLFERLFADLLIDKPIEPIDYVINWMQKEKKGDNQNPNTKIRTKNNESSASNIQIRAKEIYPQAIPSKFSNNDNYESKINNDKKNNEETKKNSNKSDSENGSEEEEDPELERKIKEQQNKSKNMRTSVSAEAYGNFNKKNQYVPKIVPKSEQQLKKILTKIDQVWMFNPVAKEEKEILAKVMEEKNFKKNDIIIQQGDKYGQHLYLVDQGELDCFKNISDNNVKFLKKYHPGEAFGELALLYNAPRAATITCSSDECVLFALDREAFNHIVREAAIKKREKYETLLGKIDLLKNMEHYEKMQIIDALKPECFQKGQYIIRQGDEGDSFYFVDEGEAVAVKNGKDVMTYKSGDYFGELALLKNEPRQASIVASTTLNLLSLDRNSFQRLLGPLDEIMRREMKKYVEN